MKKIYLLVFTILLTFLSSCVTLFESDHKIVTITTPSKYTKLYIDDKYIGIGDTFKVDIKKDQKSKQLIFKSDSLYDDAYLTISQTYLSNGMKANTAVGALGVAFVIIYGFIAGIENSAYGFASVPMFIGSGIVDGRRDNLYNMEDNYKLNKLYTSIYNDSLTKKINIIEVKESDNLIKNSRFYIFNNDLQKVLYCESLDSFNLINGTNNVIKNDIKNEVNNYLIQRNFTDSIFEVFNDNINNYNVICEVDYLKLYKNWHWNGSKLKTVKSDVEVNWIMTNNYNDTIVSKKFSAESGQFSGDSYDPIAELKSISHSIKNSLNDFIKYCKEKKYLEIESNQIKYLETIPIQKPSKYPNNLKEAMKASVIIKTKEGHGSGFFISNDGYIVTNYHVISNKNDLKVILDDGNEVKAKVARINKALDLALIKIEGNNELAFNLPLNQNFKIGEDITAIGTPKQLELGQTVTKGIVSGFRKRNELKYLQTDIPLSPGNSGGPIILDNGQLVSVVDYKIVGKGVEGLSFSIPAFEIVNGLGLNYK